MCKCSWARLWAVPLLLLASSGALADLGCASGPVRAITVAPSGIEVATNSIPYQGFPEIIVTDGAGNRIPDVGLVITLPDSEPSGVFFYEGGKTLYTRTPWPCGPYVPAVPAVRVGATPGVFQARIAYDQDPSIFTTFEYRVIPPPVDGLSVAWNVPSTSIYPVGSGRRIATGLAVSITRAMSSACCYVAGTPVTFTVPNAVTFDDGSHVATVLTDATGAAVVPPFVAVGSSADRLTITATVGSLPAISTSIGIQPSDTAIALSSSDATASEAFGTTNHVSAQLAMQSCGVAQYALWITLNGRRWLTPDLASNVQCLNGTVTSQFTLAALPFGHNEIQATYDGDSLHVPAQSNVVAIDVQPQAAGNLAAGGTWRAAAIGHDFEAACPITEMTSSAPGASGAPSAAPPGQSVPFGYFSYKISACVGPGVRLVVELDQEIPTGATAWLYVPGTAGAQGTWQLTQAKFEGHRAQVLVSGNADTATTLAIAAPLATGLMDVGGLWWGGASQSGWGLDLAQHGEQVVATLFMYADLGRPRWLIVPGGTWSADHRTFSGSFYRPSWDVSHAVMIPGNPIGDAKIVFTDASHATLQYTIDGIVGSRSIEREVIADPSPIMRWNNSDLWWYGAAQSGRGIAMVQQGDLLFSVTYGYDYLGLTTWWVMTNGRWLTPFNYLGQNYRSTGPAFLSPGYDPAKVVVIPGPSVWGYDFAFYTRSQGWEIQGGYVVDTDNWFSGSTTPIEPEPF